METKLKELNRAVHLVSTMGALVHFSEYMDASSISTMAHKSFNVQVSMASAEEPPQGADESSKEYAARIFTRAIRLYWEDRLEDSADFATEEEKSVQIEKLIDITMSLAV